MPLSVKSKKIFNLNSKLLNLYIQNCKTTLIHKNIKNKTFDCMYNMNQIIMEPFLWMEKRV